MKIKPLGNNVLLKLIEEDEQVRGGIIIPDSAKEKPQEAKIIEVGTGKLDPNGNLIPIEVKPGDKVIVPSYGGTSIKIDGAAYTILNYDSILAVVK
jgi:chaperonin GroES